MNIKNPVNEVQRRFNEICDLGGGPNGGPARTRVQELLVNAGKSLNEFAYDEISSYIYTLSDRDPWKVCFAVGLAWGRLAKLEFDFIDKASNVLQDWNFEDLNDAKSFKLERGPETIEHSLIGGYQLFKKVNLPQGLPDTLYSMGSAQQRWFSPILHPESRPRYIGPWNATSMFMVALFVKPDLVSWVRGIYNYIFVRID